MLRKMTKDVGKRLKAGNVHDYPRDVWHKIAADAKQKLEDFSEALEHNPAYQSVLKGRGPIKKARLGA